MRIGSLFAGIGGLELGLERAGVGRTAWQVERDPYASAVLAKHWPEAKRHDDVTTFPPDDGTDWSADVICGGFPCQDISYAGKGAGIDGSRSGLWREYARIVRLLRPRFVVVENSPALLRRGLGAVLGDLAGIGFDAEWFVLSACSLGAPHVRRRLFIVAYSDACNGEAWLRTNDESRLRPLQTDDDFARARLGWSARMENPSALYRGANGVRDWKNRVQRLGNAVVPQVAEVVGRRLMEIASARGGSAQGD